MASRRLANRSLGITAVIGVALLPLVYLLSALAIYAIPPRPDRVVSGYYIDLPGEPRIDRYETDLLTTALTASVCVTVAYVLLAGLIWGIAFVATRLMIPPDPVVYQPRWSGPTPPPLP